jgi:Outer membrane protein beta-barrel domain
MRPRDLLLNAALAAMAWSPSLSQSSPQSTPRFGIIGGANLATLTGSMFENPSNRTGFAAGLMAVLPVLPSFAIQPELMFTMKGTTSDSDGTAKIDYIELPVLARLEVPAFGRVKPFVYGGPGFAYRVGCSFEGTATEFQAPGGLVTREFRVTCDSLQAQAQRASPGFKYNTADVDGIIGGGLAFDVGGRTMTVGVRYDVGFVKFLSVADSKNRVLSFMGTLEWPFHK